MGKIAVFGKPAGGKSTLSKELSIKMDIPLYPLDLMVYQENGERVFEDIFMKRHSDLLKQNRWIIEGLGTLESFWQRIDEADTLIYIDLPYFIHYYWAVKRMIKSIFIKPEGWHKTSPIFKGTLLSLKYLRLSPDFWTSELLNKILSRSKSKKIYKISSIKELNNFKYRSLT